MRVRLREMICEGNPPLRGITKNGANHMRIRYAK